MILATALLARMPPRPTATFQPETQDTKTD
jgi:hypothetical protein